MKPIKKTKKHRYCEYCDRYIPSQYNFNEHKKICKNINPSLRG